MRTTNPLLVVSCVAWLTTGCALHTEEPEPASEAEATHTPQAKPAARTGSKPHPRAEPRSRYGNPKKYTQNGKTYFIKARAPGYRERGIASWYGKQFHGRKTSNGEIFDMHAISAAHKTLPLPSWVAVTDLKTGQQITVRVNDRGPFHPGRIIDLSYAAAKQLGIASRGVAPVEVRVITGPLEASAAGDAYLQLGAFRNRSNAERMLSAVRDQGVSRVTLRKRRNMNLVVHGPVPHNALDAARRTLRRAGFSQSTLIYLP